MIGVKWAQCLGPKLFLGLLSWKKKEAIKGVVSSKGGQKIGNPLLSTPAWGERGRDGKGDVQPRR